MRQVNSRLLLALSAGAAACGAALLASASATARATAAAVSTGGTFQARLTGYWPFSATASERRMEGGLNDRRGKPLHTLEDFKAGRAPYVAVSGDDQIFPYGQKLEIDQWPGVVFRVVDTGGHFRGAGKSYRAMGREPLDVCVDSSRTRIIPEATARIIKGDHFDKPGKEIATSGFRGQVVSVGCDLDMLGAEEM